MRPKTWTPERAFSNLLVFKAGVRYYRPGVPAVTAGADSLATPCLRGTHGRIPAGVLPGSAAGAAMAAAQGGAIASVPEKAVAIIEPSTRNCRARIRIIFARKRRLWRWMIRSPDLIGMPTKHILAGPILH